MILSSHVAVGTAVAVYSQNPITGFLVGFAFHHLIDMIPHTDAGSQGASIYNFLDKKGALKQVSVDIVLVMIILVVAVYMMGLSLLLFCCVIGSILPDIIDNSPFWSPRLRKIFPFNYYHQFHEFFHFTITNKKYYWLGYLTQFVIIAISLYIVVK